MPIGGQFGYKIQLPQFRSIVVKAGTPPDRIKLLANELRKVAQTAEYKAYLKNQYADPNSYISMDGARKFMDAWLADAKKFRAEAGMGSN